MEKIVKSLDPRILKDFPPELHKFKPAAPKRLEELIEDIKQNGIINPIVVRQLENGDYQIIAGHNRRTAAILADFDTVPCLEMTDLTDEDAIQIMISDNLMNRELLPSERGWAYRQQLEVQKRQGRRTDLEYEQNEEEENTLGNPCPRSENAREGLDEKASGRTVSNYIRLTYLIDPLLDLVDEKKIGVLVGVQISYLSRQSQETVYDICYKNEPIRKLSEAQAKELRAAEIDPDNVIDEAMIESLFVKKDKKLHRILKLEMSDLREWFPSGTPEEVAKATILAALAAYAQNKDSAEE